MNKPSDALNELLLPEPPPSNSKNYAVEFEPYDPSDEESKITKIECCKFSWSRGLLFGILSFTLVPLLLAKWFRQVRRFFFYAFCPISEATHVIVHANSYDIIKLEEIQLASSSMKSTQTVKRFTYRCFGYYYNEEDAKFLPVKFPCERPYTDLRENFAGGIKTKEGYENGLKLYGKCQIDVPYKGVIGILFDEVITPFYIFQVGSVILWMFEDYTCYATVIMLMALISATAEVMETRSNLLNIRAMATYECPIKVFRSCFDSSFTSVSSSTLVPGDIIEVPEGSKMPCDCVLLHGTAVINEALLTGESVPVVKAPLPFGSDLYNPENDKKYTLYAGTEVVQTRTTGDSKVVGLVVRTGFATAKGALVRYILYPKQTEFRFYSDSYKFIMVMFSISIIGMFSQFLSGADLDNGDLIIRCLDLITITVPPALPACLSIGISFALSRLKAKQIYCISPPRINMAGRINLFCFDKTGTLTEEGLSVYGYRIASRVSETVSAFHSFKRTVKGLQPEAMYEDEAVYDKYHDSAKSLFLECLSCCHSLTKVKGKIIGDPLEVEMFSNTGWVLDESEAQEDFIATYVMPKESQKDYNWALSKEEEEKENPRPYQLGIVRRFDFTSKLQRMSVLAQNLKSNKYRLFTKGSPEKIAELSIPETVPSNFSEILSFYTQKGCRVLGLATRPLNLTYRQSQKVNRELVEQKLHFLGFLILRNSLKDQTPGVINTLREANVRTVMITGDNAYTAISVAQECGMIEDEAKVYLGEVEEGADRRRVLKWTLINKKTEDEDEKVEEEEEKEGNAVKSPNSPIIEFIPRKTSEVTELRSIGSNNELNVLLPIPEVDSSLDFQLPWEDDGENCALGFTGKAFELLMDKDPESKTTYTNQILARSVVFARMSPESKALLVSTFQKQKNLVGMCGDGANDCVALKTANVGISLSDAEASIAAPFTSRIADISCVLKVLIEGRAALATSFQCFKYMALYSMIQFTSVSIFYTLNRNLTDSQCLIIDLFIIVPLAITMGRTEPARKLSKRLPEDNLLSSSFLTSILGQVLIQVVFQIGMYMYVQRQEWYIQPDINEGRDDRESIMCHANTVVFLVSSVQYLATVVAFSIGKPFKKPMYTNFLFILNVLLLLILNAYIILTPDKYTRYIFDMDYEGYKVLAQHGFLLVIALVAVVNSAVTYGYEVFLSALFSQKKKKKKKDIIKFSWNS